ncbi:Sulphate transporter [Modestobacter italicus]|uniref:Sulphate transporter n=1 Tax=Modestobacter italicus (strain DSM 44449 / CECT 9708 / BC 501) TaxID=2732864 RepID=I4EYH4_MODI5|nr:SulP family inorganic anion transporter [Modestobacter marinus]CCH88437.1 Sulphate transporter [Modestobacter marinus]
MDDENGEPRTGGSSSRLKSLPGDALAGAVNAVVSVPSGMATAALAGVNPVYGLYATVVSPPVGGLLASSQLMQIATTGASALAAGQAVSGYPAQQRGPALFLLVLIAGLFLVAFGLLRAGTLVRYISYPVMTAFLSGVAAVLVMDQSAQFAGYETGGSTSLGSFVDLLLHVGEFSWRSVVIGGIALALMIGLGRTRLSNISSLVALLVPSVIAYLWQPGDVQIVNDVSEIPSGLPPFALPDLGLLSVDLVVSAFAVAVVIAVQGAGVSQSVPNPDGSRADTSRDMLGQGAGNAAASFFSGMPTGASVSQSALNVQVGARSRLAGVFHGVFMLLVILVAAELVGQVPMPVLAAIMMVAGFSAIRFSAMRSAWSVGGTARWAVVVTFLATLLLSIPAAVATGVVMTLALFIYQAAQTTEVHELTQGDDGEIRVGDAPDTLPAGAVTVLDVYGPLFFAAARTLRERLPDAGSADHSAVVLRIRGNSQIGATFIEEINDYAHELGERGGRLYLCGMTEDLADKLRRADRLALGNEVVLVPGTNVLGSALREAVQDARTWLDGRDTDGRQ